MPVFWNLPAACGEVSDYGEHSATEIFCATGCCPCYWLGCSLLYCILDGPYAVYSIFKDCLSCIPLPERNYAKKEYKKRQKKGPRPLPSRRRRLTLPLQERPKFSVPRKPQTTLDQHQSPLFKLPAELREVIWKDVMGDKVFHLFLRESWLQHGVCRVCEASNYREGPAITCWPTHHTTNYPVNCAPQRFGVLALPKTCRRIYSETIDLAYSTNTFSFNELDCVRMFASATLRMDAIKSLRLYYDLERTVNGIKPWVAKDWQSFCDIVYGMKSLKDLRLKFDGMSHNSYHYKLFALGPLLDVRGLDVFQIYVPRYLAHPFPEQSHPFQLIDVRKWPQQ